MMSEGGTVDLEKARAIAVSLRDTPGALLPIVHTIQSVFGHVPEMVEPVIADVLNISRADVHGFVSFYHDFRREPPGRHILKLCRAEACQAAGGEALAARAEAATGIAFGETTKDGALTLEAVYCLGLCAVAPSAMLDGKVAGRLDAARLDSLIAKVRA
jgi:formate dehydrogenase subunit gamma